VLVDLGLDILQSIFDRVDIKRWLFLHTTLSLPFNAENPGPTGACRDLQKEASEPPE